MPKRLDKKYPCHYCGTPTRKRINRGTVARCADCGTLASIEANRRMAEAFAELRAQGRLRVDLSIVDTE